MGGLAGFVGRETVVRGVPFVPEIVMHTADEAIALWERTESRSGEMNPPFWAFPWAGGQALARYVLDHPVRVRGKHVLDLASGSGLVAIAAARAGAASVIANDVDPYAMEAIRLNAVANAVEIRPILGDLLGNDGGDVFRNDDGFGDEWPEPAATVVLAGDIFYSREMTDRMLGFLRRAARAGADVLVGDPLRAYAPRDVEEVARYDVPVVRDLEDLDVKPVRVIRIAA
jgi:predicted nicotinamide N-methyase